MLSCRDSTKLRFNGQGVKKNKNKPKDSYTTAEITQKKKNREDEKAKLNWKPTLGYV